MLKSFKRPLAGVLATTLLAATPLSSFAGADSGFYIGAGVGDTSLKIDSFDESDSSYKIFGGYNFGYVPLIDLAIEASYVDFGNPSTNNASADVTGINAFGLAGLSFGPFGVFAKAGMLQWDADLASNNMTASDDGTDPAYGIGARFAIASFAIRAEYEVYDVDDADVEMISVSGVITF